MVDDVERAAVGPWTRDVVPDEAVTGRQHGVAPWKLNVGEPTAQTLDGGEVGSACRVVVRGHGRPTGVGDGRHVLVEAGGGYRRRVDRKGVGRTDEGEAEVECRPSGGGGKVSGPLPATKVSGLAPPLAVPSSGDGDGRGAGTATLPNPATVGPPALRVTGPVPPFRMRAAVELIVTFGVRIGPGVDSVDASAVDPGNEVLAGSAVDLDAERTERAGVDRGAGGEGPRPELWSSNTPVGESPEVMTMEMLVMFGSKPPGSTPQLPVLSTTRSWLAFTVRFGIPETRLTVATPPLTEQVAAGPPTPDRHVEDAQQGKDAEHQPSQDCQACPYTSLRHDPAPVRVVALEIDEQVGRPGWCYGW